MKGRRKLLSLHFTGLIRGVVSGRMSRRPVKKLLLLWPQGIACLCVFDVFGLLRKLWLLEVDHTVQEVHAGQRWVNNNNKGFLGFVPTTTKRREKGRCCMAPNCTTTLLRAETIFLWHFQSAGGDGAIGEGIAAVFTVKARVGTKCGILYGSASAANVGVVRPRLAHSAHCFDF